MMNAGEEELADEEGQDEGQQEEQEVGPEGEDAMMRSIDGEEGSGAEAGSNTMAADESPDVISSYTEAQAQVCRGVGGCSLCDALPSSSSTRACQDGGCTPSAVMPTCACPCVKICRARAAKLMLLGKLMTR